MATVLTRFEIVLPNVDVGSAQDTAIQAFLASMRTLCPLVMYTAYIFPQAGGILQQNVLYGLLTSAQDTTALGFLLTLNTALGTNVLCTINSVTQEP